MKLEVHGASKKYLLKTALDDVTVSFGSGNIHALVGENGAGKSTLAGILSGNIQPTEGTILIDNEPVILKSAREALAKGIVLVHQNPNLASALTVKENVALALRWGNIGQNVNHTGFFLTLPKRELEELRQKWAPHLSLKSMVKNLGGNQRFYTSLLGALLRHPNCLILDEPSAFLDQEERNNLYANLKDLAQQDIIIIIITHSMAEAIKYADTVTVLKDGKLISRFESGKEFAFSLNSQKTDFDSSNITTETISTEKNKIIGTPCLSFNNCSSKPRSKPALLDCTIHARYGEITAITGLKEAALDTLEDLATGMDITAAKGQIHLFTKNGTQKQINLKSGKWNPSFIRKNKGALVPSDRTYRGSNPELTIEEMTSAFIKKDKYNNSLTLIKNAGITITPEQKVSSLSGGMLQRLILERELSTTPDFLILCNPMQGLDIKSQGKLSKRLSALAESGCCIIVIGCMDFPLSICSKVYEMESGKIHAVFDKGINNE